MHEKSLPLWVWPLFIVVPAMCAIGGNLIGTVDWSQWQNWRGVETVRSAPRSCWEWVAGLVYGVFSWLVFGPHWTRKLWREKEWSDWWWTEGGTVGGERWVVADKNRVFGFMPLCLVWIFAPLWFPLWFVWTCTNRPLTWLLYGGK